MRKKSGNKRIFIEVKSETPVFNKISVKNGVLERAFLINSNIKYYIEHKIF